MIEAFAAIDFVGISMQTHATLSGIRGILCFYEALGTLGIWRWPNGCFPCMNGRV